MKTYYFLNRSVTEPMTYLEFLQKRFRFNIEMHATFSGNDIVHRCVEMILNSDGKINIMTYPPQGPQEHPVMSPSYKIAFETLISLGILVEVKS